MKKLLQKLTVFVCLTLSSFYCYGQPEWTASYDFGYAFHPSHFLELENGLIAKTKYNYGLTEYISGGVDFPYMPFEVYVDVSATEQYFKAKFPEHDDYVHNFLLQLRPGFGVRFSIKSMDVSPLIQAGISYNLNLYKGFYGTKKDQLNGGTNNSFGIGMIDRDDESGFVLELVLPNQPFYNKDFTPDGGHYYPYANLVPKKMWELAVHYFQRF